MSGTIAETADVAASARIGDGTFVWHLAQVRDNVELGPDCVVGRGAYVGSGVSIGRACKLQNYALVYEPAVLEDGVFVGPGAVLTNDRHPRAVNPSGVVKRAEDWQPVGVICRAGASIGARAVCVAPLVIGRWAMVAAGSVVVKDVPDFALVVGAPARQIAWVGRAGQRLVPDGESGWQCPATGNRYREEDGLLVEDDVAERKLS